MTISEMKLAVIGAGPAATGILAALNDHRLLDNSAVILTGASFNEPSVALSGVLPKEPNQSISPFGLPTVRAYGPGGTTSIWHGGLFVPDPSDRIRYNSGAAIDLSSGLQCIMRSETIAKLPVSKGLRLVTKQVEVSNAGGHSSWRTIMVPKAPSLVSPFSFAQQTNIAVLGDVALSIRPRRKSGWEIRSISASGVKVIHASKVVLAAGSLSTLALLGEVAGVTEMDFSDHLHVFVGSISKRALPSQLAKVLFSYSGVLRSYSARAVWKKSIEIDNTIIDVALSFRPVADPDFPRTGRRYGEFLTSRSKNIYEKSVLAVQNPLTSIEMLALKYGISLPFDAILVHATISMACPSGSVRGREVEFRPNKVLAAAAAKAVLLDFANFHSIPDNYFNIFEESDVCNSVVSGAQFSASEESSGRVEDIIKTSKRSLFVADTSAFKFTSVYNQGMLSLVHGYKEGIRLSETMIEQS